MLVVDELLVYKNIGRDMSFLRDQEEQKSWMFGKLKKFISKITPKFTTLTLDAEISIILFSYYRRGADFFLH